MDVLLDSNFWNFVWNDIANTQLVIILITVFVLWGAAIAYDKTKNKEDEDE